MSVEGRRRRRAVGRFRRTRRQEGERERRVGRGEVERLEQEVAVSNYVLLYVVVTLTTFTIGITGGGGLTTRRGGRLRRRVTRVGRSLGSYCGAFLASGKVSTRGSSIATFAG